MYDHWVLKDIMMPHISKPDEFLLIVDHMRCCLEVRRQSWLGAGSLVVWYLREVATVVKHDPSELEPDSASSSVECSCNLGGVWTTIFTSM